MKNFGVPFDAPSGGTGNQTGAAEAVRLGILPSPQGRLTLVSGTPRMVVAVSGAGTVYYTPDVGNLTPLWNGSAFVPTTFAELSQALNDTTNSPSAAAAGNVYDLFVWLKAGVPTLTRGFAWTAGATAGSNTARGSGAGSTALTRVSGLLVNQYAIANGPAAGYGTYVGTVATDAGGATVSFSLGGAAANGTAATIGLWNRYNSVPFKAQVQDTTSGGWTYTSASWRAAHGSATMRATFVSGDVSTVYDASYDCILQNSAANGVGYIAVAFDATNAPTGSTGMYQSYANGSLGSVTSRGVGNGLLGQHFVSAIELGSTGQGFFGVNAPFQSAVLIVTGSY